jgi:hypothetical protein
MSDVGQPIGMLANFSVTSKEPLAERFLEAERGRDASVDLRRGVLSVHVHLLRRHPVDVELREVDGVVDLQHR